MGIMMNSTISPALAEMLTVSNSRATYQNQLHLAKLRFTTACHVPYAGGSFVVDPVLIAYLSSRLQVHTEQVIVEDAEHMPVMISDLGDFVDIITSQYYQALNAYWDEIQRLRSSRKPEVMVEVTK